MSDWNAWQSAFERLTLKQDGDSLEMRAATQHGLDVSFPNHTVFWRRHVVPATNRPANLDLRKEASQLVSQIATLNHSLLDDLVKAADELDQVRVGNLGANRFQHCSQAINYDGNAIQKFTDLQELIENSLSNALNRDIKIWSKADWKNKWSPSREKIICYRNLLTHTGQPQYMMVPQPNQDVTPYVIDPKFIVIGETLTWSQQEELYRTNPEKWSPLATVCVELHEKSISWLNDVYAEVVIALDQDLINEDYHWLWGWDTTKHGRQCMRYNGPYGIYGRPPAATGVQGRIS